MDWLGLTPAVAVCALALSLDLLQERKRRAGALTLRVEERDAARLASIVQRPVASEPLDVRLALLRDRRSNMSKVDTARLKKNRTLRAPKPALAPSHAGAVARVKGTDEALQRWTVHRRADDGSLGPPVTVQLNDKPHHVFLAFKEAFNAGVALKLFMSRMGSSIDDIDMLRVRMYQPNGWTPPHAVLVTKQDDDIKMEIHDLTEALLAEASRG